MFVLVDSLNLYSAMDAYFPPPGPNLGSACLAGSCRQQGIDMQVFDLTGAFLSRALGESTEEIINAMAACRDSLPLFLSLNKAFLDLGAQGLQGMLQRNLKFCFHPGPDEYTNSSKLIELGTILKSICALYSIYCTVEKPTNIQLVANIAQDILCRQGDVIGISVQTMHNSFLNVLISECRRQTTAPMIAGGRSTFTADGAIDRRFFFQELRMDYCLAGYADQTLPALLTALSLDGDIDDIAHLHTKDARPVHDDCPSQQDKPVAQPDFSDMNLDRFFFPERLLPIQTARGCYWKKCAFCRRDVHQPEYFEFSDKNVRRQLHQAVDVYKSKYLMIASECLHPNQARRLSKTILESDNFNTLNLMAATRPASGFDKKTIGLMAEAGFRTLFWGIESGDAQQLQNMGKGTTVQENENLLHLSYAAGISNLCFFLLGFPGETELSVLNTLEFIKRNRKFIDYFRMNPFMLFPDTHVFQAPETFNIACGELIANQDSHDFEIQNAMTRKQAAATVELIREKYLSNRARFVNTRFSDPDTVGKGDEKLPFFFWQARRATLEPVAESDF